MCFLGYQKIYNRLKESLNGQGIRAEFIQSDTVTEADLEAMADVNGGQTLIIIDDNSVSAASSKEMAQVFTVARHKNCSIVLLLHFIFGPWPSSRIISANTAYFFLLKSPRLANQVSILGSQLGKQQALMSKYLRESKKAYGFVLVDLCTKTPDHHRLRTDIFHQEHTTVTDIHDIYDTLPQESHEQHEDEPQVIHKKYVVTYSPDTKKVHIVQRPQEKPKEETQSEHFVPKKFQWRRW